jgi:flagellar biosynthesis chaperone FliJ
MREAEYQQVIDELEQVIQDTRTTIERFESSGMGEQMPEDYDKLLVILDDAVKQQREHTQAMLRL